MSKSDATEAKPKSGRYMIHNKPASCVARDGFMSVFYDDGSYTAAYFRTFTLWGAVRMDKESTT